MEYIEELRQAIGNDMRIEIHDVTENVDKYYRVRSSESIIYSLLSYYFECVLTRYAT